MREAKKEPKCEVPAPPPPPVTPRGRDHVWVELGKEDSGEVVSRCGHCKTLRYELNGAVRYETPAA